MTTAANDNTRPCPICGQAMDAKFRPFCSKRCADVDLGRWLTGAYAIPVQDDEEEAAEGEPLDGADSRRE